MNARQHFSDLGKRIDGLVNQLRAQTSDDCIGNRTLSDVESDSIEPGLQSLVLGGSNKNTALRDTAAVTIHNIIIPGISAGRSQQLVTPIAQQETEVSPLSLAAESKPTEIEEQEKILDVLAATLEAPLVAIGNIEPEALCRAADTKDSEGLWAQWWLDIRSAEDEAKWTIAQRYIGPWFARWVIGRIAPVVVGPGKIDRAEAMFHRLIVPYLGSDSITPLGIEVGWQTVLCIVDALAGDCSPGALTLATRLLDISQEKHLLEPSTMLAHILRHREPNKEDQIQHVRLAHSTWNEYLQFVCALPDRIANRIDPRSIPRTLLPQMHFSWLARSAVACITSLSGEECTWLSDSNASVATDFVLDLWIKLCRVGQSEILCVELAAALTVAAQTRLTVTERVPFEKDTLSQLAQAIATVPVPYRTRLTSDVVGRLDIMSSDRAGWLCQYVCRVALIAGTLLWAQLDISDTANMAISGLLMRPGINGVLGLIPQWSTSTYQAIALALQLLSGVAVKQSDSIAALVAAMPTRVFPGLLTDTVTQVLIPLWSSVELVNHARNAEIRSLTMLLLMCIAAMSPDQCTALSMSLQFTQAMPRFLDAPTALVRLAGVVVADYIVSSSRAPSAKGEEAESIDFGLDDIIRDSQTAKDPTIRASAEYITTMRRFARPIPEQLDDMEAGTADTATHGADSLDQPLESAIDRMREYSGAKADSMPLAPRQTSLTDDVKLQGEFVRPRKPVFLNDCLAYFKNSDDVERVEIALFALADSIKRTGTKAVEEVWVQVANKILHIYNRGPDSLDAAWDNERRGALVALTVKLPEHLGPFLADRATDTNLTVRDREIVLSVIATACLELSSVGMSDSGAQKLHHSQAGPPRIAEISQETADSTNNGTNEMVGAGTVVRRSRRLDILEETEANKELRGESASLQQQKRRYASMVGPAFFSPLVAQYGRSDMTTAANDMRRDAAQLARYLDTLGVILYSAASATHQISMNREFWELAKLVRRYPARHICESPPVLEALLFGIDVILSPERALSTPTLAREFRGDIADTVSWINDLLEREILGPSAVAHAARIVARLRDIQDDVYRRVTSNEFGRYSSII
ncbi:TEL2, telomere maintenance protein 2 [Coemansia sp. RSA 988]|nr:TEL2, telomere maintenance protein 2 [Coemansia sp. RSA 988]